MYGAGIYVGVGVYKCVRGGKVYVKGRFFDVTTYKNPASLQAITCPKQEKENRCA